MFASDSRSASFAPTSLDRILYRAQRSAPKLSRASDLLLIGVTALLALADLAVWATDPVVDTGRLTNSIAFLVPCLGTLATVAVVLLRRHLTQALVTLAGISMVLTIASWTIAPACRRHLQRCFHWRY